MPLSQRKIEKPRHFDLGDKTPPDAPLIGTVLLVTALVYAFTLRFSFVFDDKDQIVQDVLVHFWRFVPQYFVGQVWQYRSNVALGNYYRPLNLLWFRLNDAVFGLHPMGWHATAVGLHLLATFLAYKVARKVTGRPLVATLTALIFAVHPTRHEVVAWVSGTTESIWAVFFFFGFWAYLKSREADRGRWIAVSCVLYAAGLLSKETAIVFPGVVFMHAWIYGDRAPEQDGRNGRERLSRALILALVYTPVAIVYVIVRIHVLHGFSHAPESMSLWTLALTLPSVLFFYTKQWLLPLRISAFYDLQSRSHIGVQHVLLPLFGILFVAGIVWFFRRKLGTREVAFAAAWILLPLMPVLDLALLPAGEFAHDRYFYVPGFGAALLVSLAFEKLARGKMVWRLPQRWLLGTLVLLIPLCYDSANACRYWANDGLLYSHAYTIAPKDTILRIDYAWDLAQQGNYAKALPMLQALVKEYPDRPDVNMDLGHLLYLLRLYPAAAHYLETAEKLSPGKPDVYLELSLLDLRTNRASQAEANLRRALGLRPYEPMYHFALGTVLAGQGKCSEAVAQFTEALAFAPNFPQAREGLKKCQSGGMPAKGYPSSSNPPDQTAKGAAFPLRHRTSIPAAPE